MDAEEFVIYMHFYGGPSQICVGPLNIHMVRLPDPIQKISTKSPTVSNIPF